MYVLPVGHVRWHRADGTDTMNGPCLELQADEGCGTAEARAAEGGGGMPGSRRRHCITSCTRAGSVEEDVAGVDESVRHNSTQNYHLLGL